MLAELTPDQVAAGVVKGVNCIVILGDRCAYCAAINPTHLIEYKACGCTAPVCCDCVKTYTLDKEHP